MLHIHAHVRIPAYLHICLPIVTYLPTCVGLCVYIYVCLPTYVGLCVYIIMYAYAHMQVCIIYIGLYAYTYAYMYKGLHACMYRPICMHVYNHVCMWECVLIRTKMDIASVVQQCFFSTAMYPSTAMTPPPPPPCSLTTTVALLSISIAPPLTYIMEHYIHDSGFKPKVVNAGDQSETCIHNCHNFKIKRIDLYFQSQSSDRRH